MSLLLHRACFIITLALAVAQACAHTSRSAPCAGVESSNGVCYSALAEGWTLAELEARETLWLEAMRARPLAAEVLARLNVHVLDEYSSCGTGQFLRGCTLGPTMVRVAGLPVCRMAAMHEAAHVLFAREGDADYKHLRPEWAPIVRAESDCPPLTGDWLQKTAKALESWGVRPDGGT